MPSVKNSRKEGRKSQVLRDDDIQNRCNEDVPCTGATIQEIFSLFFSLCSYVSLFIHFRIIVKKTHIKTTTTTKQILLE